ENLVERRLHGPPWVPGDARHERLSTLLHGGSAHKPACAAIRREGRPRAADGLASVAPWASGWAAHDDALGAPSLRHLGLIGGQARRDAMVAVDAASEALVVRAVD